MVAPYTLILTTNGSKKAWPPRKTPRKKGGGSLGGPVEGKLFLFASQDDGNWRALRSILTV
jgi:hypothetical protein